MNKKIKILLFLIIAASVCFAQESKKQDYVIAVDYNNLIPDIIFQQNSFELTEEGKQALDNIGKSLTSEEVIIMKDRNCIKVMKDKYYLLIIAATSLSERKINANIVYERVEFMLKYLETNFNIERNLFLFQFTNSEVENENSYMRLEVIPI